MRNLSTKTFKSYRLPDHKNSKDELDLLILRTIRANDTVKKELARLNKIENYRKEFIGDISQELKTPIFAIQGFVETERKTTRLNSTHVAISYAVFCLKKTTKKMVRSTDS